MNLPRNLFWVGVLLAALTGFLAILPVKMRQALLSGLLAERWMIALALSFGVVTLSLLWSAGERLDAWVFLYVNRHRLRSLAADRLWFALTQLGNGPVGFLLAGFFALTREMRLAFELALGILSLWLTVEAIKYLVGRARPYTALAHTRVVGWRERGRSFPSGHTSQAFMMVAVIIHYFHLQTAASLALYMAALGVGFSRLYLGVHYPRDVAAGALLGSLWGLLISLLDPYLATHL